MNPLEEMPHVFANGKFRVRIPDNNMKSGYRERELTPHIVQTSRDGILQPNLSNCQLIARPIESLTDEEWQEMLDKRMASWDGREWSVINTFDAGLHLLSIGVYPFDQSHFGETVIDSREVV